MSLTEILQVNLLSPLVLAFLLGIFARVVKSDLALPKDLYTALSIYLLFAIGLKGGVELSHAALAEIAWPAVATLCIGIVTPLSAFLVLRRLGKFGTADAAGIAAHYGSVSAVTFIAASQFVLAQGIQPEGFMPTLLMLLESPGLSIAIALGVMSRAKQTAAASGVTKSPLGKVLHEVLCGRTMMLLMGGLVAGYLSGSKGYEPIKPFFEGGFKGALTLFLLEMGLLTADRLGDLKKAGAFLLGFGVVMPIVHGLAAVLLGQWAGLSIGGCTILGAMAASASYIAAPPAVRMSLPEANPTLSLTAALVITFPFNLTAGIPLYYQAACWSHGTTTQAVAEMVKENAEKSVVVPAGHKTPAAIPAGKLAPKTSSVSPKPMMVRAG